MKKFPCSKYSSTGSRWLDEWSANLIDITRTAALKLMFAFRNWNTLYWQYGLILLWKTYLFGICRWWKYQVFCQNYVKGIDWGPNERGRSAEKHPFQLNIIFKMFHFKHILKSFSLIKILPFFCSYLENSFFVYSILVLSKQLPFSCKVGVTFDISCGSPLLSITRPGDPLNANFACPIFNQKGPH